MAGSLILQDTSGNLMQLPADGMAYAGSVPVALGISNGTTLDLAREATADALTKLLAAAQMLYNGATWDRERSPNVFKKVAAQAITAGTPVTVWTPATGKKFRLMGFMLSLSVAGSVIFKDGGNADAELVRTCLMSAGVGQASPWFGNGILGSAANGTLDLDVSATGNVSGFVFGTEE